MKSAQPISTNVTFPVALEPVFTKDGWNTGYSGVVRRDLDTPKTLGIHSPNYGLVQNGDLLNRVEQALDERALEWTDRRSISIRGGSRMFASYELLNQQVQVPKVGDLLGVILTINNSYDGSSIVSAAVNFKRLICSNGMKGLTREFSLMKKHTSGISIDYIGTRILEGLDKVQDSLNVFGRLAEKSISHEVGVRILERMEQTGVISGRIREGILGVWNNPSYASDKARNLYNLYNATTQFLTRNVRSERFELSERVNHDVLGVLAGRTRDVQLVSLVS
jgi:hypothetical protein